MNREITQKLCEVAEITMGQSPESESYNDKGDGIPFYQGKSDFGEVYPTVRMYCTSPKKIAMADDILMSVRAPIGDVNIAQEKCCIGRGLAAIRPKGNTNLKYLFYLLDYYKERLAEQGTGSTFKAISKDILNELHIPIWPLGKQKWIADVIDEIQTIIFNRKETLSILDELVKSRFIEMFGDPVANSKKYPVYKFSDITTSRLGKMLDKKRQTGKNNYPYLANYNVQWFRLELDNLNEMDFDEADRQEFELKNGDLLVCEGGEVGRCAIWRGEKENCYFQKALHRVRCDPKYIIPEYLGWTFYWHSQYNGFIDAISGVSTIAHLPGDKLKQLQIIVPPLELQNQFADFVAQADKSKLAVQQSIETLQTLKAKLMQDYFG